MNHISLTFKYDYIIIRKNNIKECKKIMNLCKLRAAIVTHVSRENSCQVPWWAKKWCVPAPPRIVVSHTFLLWKVVVLHISRCFSTPIFQQNDNASFDLAVPAQFSKPDRHLHYRTPKCETRPIIILETEFSLFVFPE